MMIGRDFKDLSGQNVLIVEDEYFLAAEMADAGRLAGATVLRPVPDVESALRIIDTQHVDAAILDIRLGDDTSFRIADTLKKKNVPIVFVTGYDDWFLPDDLDDVPIFRKPADPENVVRLLFDTVKRRGG